MIPTPDEESILLGVVLPGNPGSDWTELNIVALDVSLNCTGYATSSGCGVLIPPKNAECGYERVRWILDSIWNLTETADLTVIEGYAFGVKNQRGIISIHELGGVIRFTFWEN